MVVCDEMASRSHLCFCPLRASASIIVVTTNGAGTVMIESPPRPHGKLKRIPRRSKERFSLSES